MKIFSTVHEDLKREKETETRQKDAVTSELQKVKEVLKKAEKDQEIGISIID